MVANDLGPAVVAVAWTFAALATLVVGTRIYVRLRILKTLRIDDYIILLTLLLGFGNSIFLTISAKWGLGQHVLALQDEPERAMYTVKWVYLCEFFSIMCPGFGRISVAFLLLSIIPPGTGRKYFLWGVIGAQLVVDIGTVIISFLQCRPIEGFWDKSVDADCWPPHVQQYTGFVQGSVCSLVDLVLALFPATLFWSLRMEWKQKAALSGLMGLGVFAMIASIVKTVGLRALTETEDLTYAMAHLALWWTLEAYLVMITASMPALRPIFKCGRGHTRDVSGYAIGYGGEQSGWSPSKRAKTTNPDGGGPFMTLSQPGSSREEIDLTDWGPPIKNSTYRVNAAVGCEDPERDNATYGIRRNTTVTVVYGKQSSGGGFRG